MFISSSGMPERVTCKISGRYVPISPTYDQNEFVKFYNKETHQNSFFKILSTFHQILDFFIAKLLSDLQINPSLEKNSKLAKNNRRKKPKKILKKSNYFTKTSTNWTPRLLSFPTATLSRAPGYNSQQPRAQPTTHLSRRQFWEKTGKQTVTLCYYTQLHCVTTHCLLTVFHEVPSRALRSAQPFC